ncbi:MAG: hypothetical protein QOD77_2105 [Thermoplasmata archaeon]|jgi:hypothetical protein|nr:hypothetical protein [Thermoplasmata archaeon]
MTSAARKPAAGAGPKKKTAAKKAAPKKAAPKKAAKPAKATKPKAVAKATLTRDDAPAERGPAPMAAGAGEREAEEARQAEAIRKAEAAEHEHQDPRGGSARFDKHSKEHKDPRKIQDNIKSRGIPRMNPIVNWFRRAPKRPQK